MRTERELADPVIDGKDAVWSAGGRTIRITHEREPYSVCAHAGHVLVIERDEPLVRNLAVYDPNGALLERPRLPSDRATSFYQFDYAFGKLRVDEDGAVAVVVCTLGGDLVYWLRPRDWTLTYGHPWR